MDKYTRTHAQTAKLSAASHRKLDRFLRLSRELYNAALFERIDCYRKTGRSVSYYDQCKSLTIIRRSLPEIGEFNAVAMRSVLGRLDRSFKQFFRHGGFPRFKGRNRGIRSFETSQFRILAAGKRHAVHIKGFGRFIVREVPNNDIKLIRIVKTPIRVKVQFITEHQPNVPDVPDTSPVVGIDLGIERQATLSTGETLPKIEIDDARKRRLQRQLSKARKGSRNRVKKRLAFAKEVQRLAERQRNALHKTTSGLIQKHGGNWAVENLNVKGMTAHGGKWKRGLNRNIVNQQWGAFVQQLNYKAESAGGSVTKVNPWNTSKTCSKCGSVKASLRLAERTFDCSNCGVSLDRDHNAAINIRELGSPGGAFPGTRPDVATIDEGARHAA